MHSRSASFRNLVKAAMHNVAPANQLQAQQLAAKQLMSLAGVGAMGGIGIRSLMGLRDLIQNPQVAVSPSANLPHAITVYGKPQHPAVTAEEEENPATLPMQKLSWQALKDFGQSALNTAKGGINAVGDALEAAPQQIAQTVAPYLPETHTTKPLANEWGIPAGMLALGGGAAGGYHLTDWLLNKERNMAGNQELTDAEDEYRQALAEQYRAAMMSKGADDDLGINALADQYAARVAEHGREKQAFGMSAVKYFFPQVDQAYSKLPLMGYDNWEALKGGANAAMLATALGTGKVTYDWAKKQNKQELLRKALKQRQAARQRLSPPPIVALTDEESYAA